jgi:hypothetical protein
MKKGLLLMFCLAFGIGAFAQDKMYIYKTDKITLGAPVASTDSLYFSADGATVYFKIGDSIPQYPVSDIDSITFNDNSNTVYISYNETSVSVVNPLAFEGVSVVVDGADVVVTSSIQNKKVNYALSGTTSDGMFKIYSDYKFDLLLNGVNIANADGPAINIQSKKKCAVNVVRGTSNTLSDGSSYAESSEDQKATFFSEGQLTFEGSGTLTVSSVAKHAICSDDYIEIETADITISGAAKDGIHAGDYFSMIAGTLNITATGDGIESSDDSMSIVGGTIGITVSGDQSKGLRSAKLMRLSNTSVSITSTGDAVLEAAGLGYNPSYCTAIKSDSSILLAGADITIKSTGKAGKGISADYDIDMTSGTLKITTSGDGATYTDSLGLANAYASSCISANGNINILSGNVTASSSGLGGKGISANGNLVLGDNDHSPIVNVSTSGARILVSGTSGYASAEYANPKAIKSDGTLTMNNGTLTVTTSQAGGNGIESDSTLTIAGGTVNVTIAGNGTKAIKSTREMALNGGQITVTTTGAVVLETVSSSYKDPSYCKGIDCDAAITINGATLTVKSTGAGSKGISTSSSLTVSGGTVNVTTTGAGSTYTNSSKATDSYSSACFSTDGNVSILGGLVTLSSSGLGGKGITSDALVTIGSESSSPIINITTSGAKFLVSGTDYCHPKAIVSATSIIINNGTTTISSTDDGMHAETALTQNSGTVTITTSVEGVESKTITINGGNMYVTASNDGLNGTAGTVSGGAENNDGSYIYFKGGTVVATCTNGDAIDCNGSIVMTGGTVVANGPQSGVEEAADFNGSFNMNGGFFIGAGSNSTMTKSMSSSSTQRNFFISSNSVISSSTLLHIQNSNGIDILTFKPLNGGYKFLFSSSALTNGSTYSIYTGGSTTGTATNGVYSGGTYSNGTLKKTVTLSSIVTSVSF